MCAAGLPCPLPPLSLKLRLLPFPEISLRTGRKWCDTDYVTVSCSLNANLFYFYASIHFSKTLRISLILCPFNRVIVVDSLIGPMTESATGFGSVNCDKHEFYLVEQAYVVRFSHNMCVNNALVGIFDWPVVTVVPRIDC